MAQTSDQPRPTLAERTVVDCDVHVAHEAPDVKREIGSRMDEPYRTHLNTEGPNYAPYPRDSIPKDPVGEREGADNLDASTFAATPEELQSGIYGSMDIDVTILNSLQKLDLIPVERSLQEMPAVNDTLLDRFLDDNDHYYGLALLGTQRPEKTAEELDRLGDEESIVGGLIINGASDKPLGDPRYDPIYRAAADNGLTMVFHSATIGYTLNKRFSFLYDDLNTYATVHTLAHPLACMTTVASLIMNGVPAKFPDLDFAFLEMDLGVVPLLMYRMNREARQQSYDLTILEKSPEQYLRERFYWGTQPLPEPERAADMRHLIEMIGVENILFASDHPHADFDSIDSVIDSYFGHLSVEEQDRILCGNALEAFDVSVP